MMLRVSIESPFRAPTLEQGLLHIAYARRAFRHSLARGEAPFASHLFYTTILDDEVPAERELGLVVSDKWRSQAHLLAFYVDFGISPGMKHAEALAQRYSIPTAYRTIGKEP